MFRGFALFLYFFEGDGGGIVVDGAAREAPVKSVETA